MSTFDRRDLLARAAAFAGFATVSLLPGTAAAATRRRPGAGLGPSLTAGDTAVTARVDARRALEYLRVLSDEIGWRVTGTRQERRAVGYIAKVLRDLGCTVELQQFPVPDKNLAELRAGGARWQSGAALKGAAGRAEGDIADLGAATEVTGDLTGKIALFTRVTGRELDQAKAGIAAGNFSWRGGEGPAQLEPVYHTPEDTVAGNVSLDRLQVSLELIGCAAYEVACH